MARLTSERGAADERLETAALAAVVQRSVRVDDHVSDLAGGSLPAAMQLAVDDQTAAHARRPRDVDHVSRATTRAVVKLAEPSHVGVVGQLDLGPGGAAQHRGEGYVLPWQVGRVDQDAALDVDRTGGRDGDAADFLAAAVTVDLRRRPVDQSLRRAEQGGPGLDAGEQFAVGARQPDAHLGPA